MIKNSEAYNMYKEIKGSDFTYLSEEDFAYLINENKINSLRERIMFCMNNTKSMDDNKLNDKIMNSHNIIENEYIDIMLYEKNLLKLKKYIRDILFGNKENIRISGYIENLQGKESMDEVFTREYEYLLCVEQADYQEIRDAKDIDELKKIIDIKIKEFERAKVGSEEDKITCMSEYYAKKIEFLNVLFMMDDIYDIKDEYKVKGKTSNEDIKLLVEQYVVQRQEMLDNYEIKNDNKETNDLEVPLNRSYDFNFKKVYNQMISKVIGRNEQIRIILNLIKENDYNPVKRSSLIIAGGTGTGKTETFRQLKEALKDIRPVWTVDTNELTETGYHGGSIETSILTKLLEAACEVNRAKGFNYTLTSLENIETAEHGIVFLDEIDKRVEESGGKSNVNKSAVVNELLKLFDSGTTYDVTINNQKITFDVSNLTLAAGGAFQEYFDKIIKDNKKGALGFEKTAPKTELKGVNIDPQALIKYGLSSQFVARTSVALLYLPHTAETLKQLEENESTSFLLSKIKMYQNKGIEVVWEDDYIDEYTKKAYDMNIGGRAIQSVVNKALGSLNIEIEQRKDEYDVKIIYLTKESIKDSGKIKLITSDDQIVSLQELYDKTKKEDRMSLAKKKILRNDGAYQKVLRAMSLYEG